MSDIFTEGTIISNNTIFDAERGLVTHGSIKGEYMNNQIDSDSHCIEASGSPSGIYHCNQLYRIREDYLFRKIPMVRSLSLIP
jgi:hypothetical protein